MNYTNVALEKRIRDYLQTRVKAMGEQRFLSEKSDGYWSALLVYAIAQLRRCSQKQDIIMDGYMENLQSISIAQTMLRCKISNQFFTLPVMRAICEAQTLGV